jgi:hypothetical protein
MAHMNMWVASGCMNWKSQKLLCAWGEDMLEIEL